VISRQCVCNSCYSLWYCPLKSEVSVDVPLPVALLNLSDNMSKNDTFFGGGVGAELKDGKKGVPGLLFPGVEGGVCWPN
jgi:hypothetical protein